MLRSISLAVLTVVLAATEASAATTDTAAASNPTEQNGDMTYYYLSKTACGQTYTNTDMVAAIASDWFTTANPNEDPICGRQVQITDPKTGETVQVEIRDMCPECKHGDIDVSPAAFKTLQPLVVGRYKVSWVFV